MKKIAVFTGSRADYFLLVDLMRKIKSSKKLKLQLIVSGAHLSKKFGNTWKQIINDGFKINEKVDILVSGNNPSKVLKTVSNGLVGFTKSLKKLSPDFFSNIR